MGLDPHAAGIADGSHPDPADELTGSHGPVSVPPRSPAARATSPNWRARIIVTLLIGLALLGVAGLIGSNDSTDLTEAQHYVQNGPSFSSYMLDVGLDVSNPTLTVGEETVVSVGDVTGKGHAGLFGGGGSINGQSRPVVVRTVTLKIGSQTRSYAVDASTVLVVDEAATKPTIELLPEEGIDPVLVGGKSAPRFDTRKSGWSCGWDPAFWLSRSERSSCHRFGPQGPADFDPATLRRLEDDPWTDLGGRIAHIVVPPSALPSATR